MSSHKHQMLTLAGLPTARGIVAGPVFVYRGDGERPVPEYLIKPGGENDELMRLKRARYESVRDVEGLVTVLRQRAGHDDVRVFECHLMMLEDPVFIKDTERLIAVEHLNAEAAVRKVSDGMRTAFGRMNDPYFRERVRDLDDVERRLQQHLSGFGGNPHLELKAPSIIVANDLTPSETVQLPREFVLGFATDGGSTTSHVALLARAMGIPAVTGLGDITSRVRAGETVLLDGTNGAITLNPDEKTLGEFNELVRRQRQLSKSTLSGAPAGTLKDGGEILLYANIHPGVPVGGVRDLGARGIGLYRSEYLWLNREGEPTEGEQFVAYREAVKFAMTLSDTSTITIRTLDIGGDKMVRGIAQTATTVHEANPFLGNRSIRYLLSHQDVFRTQLRAILKASHFGRVCLMYPMVSCVEELKEAATILETMKRQLDSEGFDYDHDLKVGAMIEVPAAALNAEALSKYVDFFSIGTNDLVQYTMAADRGNDSVAHLYQPLNPAVLKLMRMTIEAARRTGVHVGVCGESAADPIVGILWAAMGVEMLSMSASYIPVITRLLARLTRADLDEYDRMVRGLPDGSTAAEIFSACNDWMYGKISDLEEILL